MDNNKGLNKKGVASNRINIEGYYFGRLKVLFYYDTHRKAAMWLCECACGNFKVIEGKSLRAGKTKSCGCILEERKYYLCGTRIHNIYKNMKTRCYLKTKGDYKYYGGRGISVCDEWKESFIAFAEWAIASGYEDGLTLDREDNSGNYSPDNCRWVTRQRQSNNMSSNHVITFNGKSLSIADWAREIGIKPDTIFNRIRDDWSEEDALTIPLLPLGVTKENFKRSQQQ